MKPATMGTSKARPSAEELGAEVVGCGVSGEREAAAQVGVGERHDGHGEDEDHDRKEGVGPIPEGLVAKLVEGFASRYFNVLDHAALRR